MNYQLINDGSHLFSRYGLKILGVLIILMTGNYIAKLSVQDYSTETLSFILLFLITVLILLYEKNHVLWLLLFIQPIMYFVRINQFYLSGGELTTRYVVTLLQPILIIMIIGGFLATMPLHAIRQTLWGDRLSRVVFIFIIYSTLQIANPAMGLTASLYGYKTLVIPIFTFYIGKILIKNTRDLLTVLKIIYVYYLTTLAYGFAQYFWGPFDFELEWLSAIDRDSISFTSRLLGHAQGINQWRIGSFFNHPSHYGAFTFFILSLFFPFLISKRKVGFTSIVFIMGSFFMLIQINVRSAILAIALSLIVQWIIISKVGSHRYNRMNSRIKLLIVSFAIIFTVNYLAQPDYLQDRLSQMVTPWSALNVLSRYASYQFSSMDISHMPFGYGLGSVGSPYLPIKVVGDSMYINLFFEGGIVGVVLFMVLIGVGIQQIYRAIKLSQGQLRLFLIGIFGFATALPFIMITMDIFKIPDTDTAIWLLFGVIPNVQLFMKKQPKRVVT